MDQESYLCRFFGVNRRNSGLGLAVLVQSEFFDQLGGDLGGVLALGVARAAQKAALAAHADHHRFAALVAIDVGRDRTGVRAGSGRVVGDDLGDQLLGVRDLFVE